jgi:hypothetical protein
MIMMSDIEVFDDPQLRENVACQLNTKFGRNPTREEIDDEISSGSQSLYNGFNPDYDCQIDRLYNCPAPVEC